MATIDIDETKIDGEDAKGDDWRLEETWRKANPNWNVSVARITWAVASSATGEVVVQVNFLPAGAALAAAVETAATITAAIATPTGLSVVRNFMQDLLQSFGCVCG